MVFRPDGRTLASIDYGTEIKLWDTALGEERATIISFDSGDWMAITPDGLFDGSPAAWSTLIWRAPRNTLDFAPVEAFFSDFFYPGLLADIFVDKRPRAPAALENKDRRQARVSILSAKPVTQADSGARSAGSDRRYMRVTLDVEEAPADKSRRQGSGARDVRLFRDGTLVKVWRGDVLSGARKVTLETDVPVLPGENRFTAYAFNRDNIKSGDATLTAKLDGDTGGQSLRRTAYVLVVGVNSYANPQYNLNYAVADADEFGLEWKKQQEQLKQYGRIEVISLLDREATKANILYALRRLSNSDEVLLPAGTPQQIGRLRYAEPQDAVVIFFAGHGVAVGQRFYLIPHDLGYTGRRDELTAEGLQQVLSHSISDDELETAFEGLQSSQTVLIIDACNSGQALEAEEKRRGPMNSKGLAQLAYEKGMYVLTASQSLQVANEEPVLGHGYLTYVLLNEGLRAGAADKEPQDDTVYLREWFRYAEERVPRLHEERMSSRTEAELARLRSRKLRDLKLAGVKDVQRPRVFYRRELEAQPLIVARISTTIRDRSTKTK